MNNRSENFQHNTIQKQLDQVWSDRWNQKVDLAFQNFAAIQVENNWQELSPLHLTQTNLKIEYAECLLLKASLLRAQGEFLKSSSLIAKTLREYSKISSHMTFKMQFELGLDHWCHDDIIHALECFLQAEKMAQSPVEKVLALSNALFSLEALDLDRKHIESQLNDLLLTIPSREIPHITQQYLSYQLRKQFFNGDFNFRFKSSKTVGQPHFFLNYISLLPYLKNLVNPKFENLLESKKYLWQGSYRLRTLQGVYIPADKNFVRVSDIIDRLYLWVWFWISGHAEMSLSKVHLTLTSILKLLELNNLSKENKLLFRNALGWIQLFSPQMLSNLETLMKNLDNIKSSNYPLLESEFLLIQKIKSLCFSKETSDIFVYSPFTTYFDNIKSGEFSLVPRLSDILSPIISTKKKSQHIRIVVDLLNCTITNKDKNITVSSFLLSRLFWFSYHKKQFQMKDVDSNFGNDKRQIYNLVSRAKKIDPDIKLKIDDKIISSTLKLNEYVFIGNLQTIDTNSKNINFLDQTTSKIEDLISASATKLSHPKHLTRKDIEKSFHLSKTSSGRVLKKWINEEIIRKEGQGKGVTYVWI